MRHLPTVLSVLLLASPLLAQDRDTKVRNDRKEFVASSDWVYNDLEKGMRAAREANKPLLVVFRCIPCEACQEFDDDVARRDPVIRDLLDEFVCVRIVQANTIDLTRFQHDFDLSFAAYLMNADLTIYGRFGTRSGRPEHEDISLEGLRKAMEAALELHRIYASVKSSLAGKQVKQTVYKTPNNFPSLAGKYGESINYTANTARSCMHCHQIRDAERLVYRRAGKPIPDEVLYPYPDPEVLGLKIDPKSRVKVERVEEGSPAGLADLRPGDEILTAAGQPLLSTADLQWVLHNAPTSLKLPVEVQRNGRTMNLTLDLSEGWRSGDISWRVTTWDLRRMGFGGLRLKDLPDEERTERGLAETGMALLVQHAGEYGEHSIAKRAGVRKGEIVIAFDSLADRMTESRLLAYTLQKKRPGDTVTLTVLRANGERATLRFSLR